MKKSFLFSTLTLFSAAALFLTGCDGNKTPVNPDPPVTDAKYDPLDMGEIPIGLWVTPPASYQNAGEYAKIRECGLNFVNGFQYNETSNSAILKVLDLCEANGLKYFANKAVVADDIRKYANNPDPALLKKFTDGIKPYAAHPAFAGELMMDEPGKPLFGAVAAFAKAFDEAYPDKMWHVNLFPSYATGGIQAPSYTDYINSWMEATSPVYLSYDYYPLLTNGTITADYYYNLDLVRAKTRFRKIPFWNFIQTLSIAGTPGVSDKREPSEADIRWQVWSSLAMGSKGIQYFCYWSPGSGSETFGEALIGVDGRKTVRYDYVKKLNSDINAIGKILMECHAEGAIQTAANNYDMYTPLYSFGSIESVSGDDSIVGCFLTGEGDKKVLITTLTPSKPAKVTLNLADGVVAVNTLQNGVADEKAVTDNKLTFSLPAGEAILVEF